MLQRMFYMEISMFQNFDLSWLIIAIMGISAGIILRIVAVKRQQDFKDSTIAVVIMCLLMHAPNFMSPMESGTRKFLTLSIVATLAPVTTFMVVGFLLMHLSKKCTDR